jgi:hypothetical protein
MSGTQRNWTRERAGCSFFEENSRAFKRTARRRVGKRKRIGELDLGFRNAERF